MHQRSYGRYTDRARIYVEGVASKLRASPPREIASRVSAIVAAHETWRLSECISLNAAENVMSARARAILNSDLASRVTEGFPGDKDFPANRQNRFTDEIEASIIYMLRRMFRAKHVEWRPVSTSMANATLFFSLTSPGDTIMVQSEQAGGNYSYNPNGPPRAAHLNVEELPFNDESFELEPDLAAQAIRKRSPKIVMVGGSNVLFPYPLRQLREAADEVGALLVYDAAHVALYATCGMFQDPLAEGAHILTFSSHKIMSGPVGGVILTNEEEIADAVLPYSFPTLVQTRDQNKYAATALALSEMLEFGPAYARQTLNNARALALGLEAEGFEVLCSNRNYTRTHQIFVLIAEEDEQVFEDLCQRANLLVTRAQRMGRSDRSAVRLTSQEISRRGMREHHMPKIANWLRRVIRDREDPDLIAAEIREFLRDFTTIRFSFDDESCHATEMVSANRRPRPADNLNCVGNGAKLR